MYTAKNGTPFNVRIVEKGDKYGRNNCLTHDKDGAMVEFYDARYPEIEFGFSWGQFVSRYYLRTLNASNKENGLNLHAGIEDWTIDAETYRSIMRDVNVLVEKGTY
jgi:hypothetical protein